jgi:hypothetical protein
MAGIKPLGTSHRTPSAETSTIVAVNVLRAVPILHKGWYRGRQWFRLVVP